MFRSATFKLTMWYLALVMAISLMFSVVLYQVTTHEVERGLRKETQRIFNKYPDFNTNPFFKKSDSLEDASHQILVRLIAFNFIVLVTSGWASYWLAKRTLGPIEEAHEQQKRFTADVSHELRTPLTAIRMESEVALMNQDISKQDLKNTLESNLEETAKLETLINNLLRLTRLEADELKQHFMPVDTSDIVKNAVEQTLKQASQKHIEINNLVVGDLVEGDRDSLVQLLVIIIDNAIKYSHEGNQVNISSQHKGGLSQLIVTDQGIGIKKAALDHVFDRFYRADNSRTKASGVDGFGLGLSIAKMISDLHDGTIIISSSSGKGTTVEVSLPRLPAASKQP